MSFFTVISPGKVGKENTTHSLIAKSSDEVTFRAGNEILLEEGFTAEEGSEFVTETIDECDVSDSECDQLPTEPQMIVMDDNNEHPTTLETNHSEDKEFKLEIFPNPFEEEVTIKFPHFENKAPWTLKIMDVKGRLIKEKEGEDAREEITINTENFIEGVFFYKVKIQEQKFNGKILKE